MKVRKKEEIEIDFYRAINRAQEIEEMADQLGALANSNMEESLNLLKKSFSGTSAKPLTVLGEEIGLGLLKAADDLLSVARNIRQTSKIIYNAEIAGLKLFD